MIDLRSDTVTKPSEEMRQIMVHAKVGDDVYGEDPTVRNLEEFTAALLGKEAGLFLPSGTQSNLTALLAHCERGDEYIVGQEAHTYRYEGGGAAVLGSIQPQPIAFETDGSLEINKIQSAIKPADYHFARTKLICLENTQAGIALELDYINKVRQLCSDNNLQLHLDGARFFNACTDKLLSPKALAQPFDTISVCLSKGLGAPVGSVLVGNTNLMGVARRWRKVLGGGMRQAGIIAAAGLFALQNNRDRLQEDHDNAASVATLLMEKLGESSIHFATNMVHLKIKDKIYEELKQHLLNHQIIVDGPRWVFHMDIGFAEQELLTKAIKTFKMK
jgi:threonine aldolase